MKANSRFEKSLVITSIVDIIRAAGGRFLKRDFQLGKWYELSDQQSKEKVGHAIRDAVSAHESKAKKDGKDKNTEQKAVPKRRPRSERKDAGDSSESSGSESRSVYESLVAVSGRPVPTVASGSGPAVPSHAISDTAVSALRIDDDGHDGHDHQFLAQIDAVLGPLSPDVTDPLAPYLKQND
jgi:hypothetical protein